MHGKVEIRGAEGARLTPAIGLDSQVYVAVSESSGHPSTGQLGMRKIFTTALSPLAEQRT